VGHIVVTPQLVVGSLQSVVKFRNWFHLNTKQKWSNIDVKDRSDDVFSWHCFSSVSLPQKFCRSACHIFTNDLAVAQACIRIAAPASADDSLLILSQLPQAHT